MPFTSPTAMARILTPKGDELALWQPDYPYLTGATIKIVRGGVPSVSVNLEIPYDEAIPLMETSMFDVGNILSVRMGYSKEGIWTPWYHGMMFEPQVDITPDGLSARLAGTPTSGPTSTSGVRQWEKTSVRSIVSEVMGEYGFKLHFEGDSADFDKELDSIEQGGLTDWEIVRKLVHDIGLTFWLGTDAKGYATVFVTANSEEHGKTPVRTFIMRGPFDTEKSQYPLLQFNVEGSVSWLPAISRGLVASDIDSDSKELVTYSADQNSTSVSSLGQKILWGRTTDEGTVEKQTGLVAFRGFPKPELAGKFTFSPVVGDQDTWKKRVQSRFDRGRASGGLKAKGVTVGNPYVLPSDLCEIMGVSRRYGGNYRVDVVEHIISGSDWTTNLDFISEGHPVEVGVGYDAPSPNTSEARKKAESANTREGE